MEEERTFLKTKTDAGIRAQDMRPWHVPVGRMCLPETTKGLTVRVFGVYCCVVLRMEPRALCVLGKDSTTAPYPQANELITQLLNFLGISSYLFLMQTSKEANVCHQQGITAGESFCRTGNASYPSFPEEQRTKSVARVTLGKIFSPLSLSRIVCIFPCLNLQSTPP